ncbi:hypothetical protein [Actinocrinis sp.]|uniref:hypothetical protein n=1 Tax=Actinocrinis sp. TaxID=1920516 RepID=UPI002D2BE52F|nr:hypothetical protein [Actinocrinis sp.]HZP54170.1 hypothetical protein [Actinocrinis sp.]
MSSSFAGVRFGAGVRFAALAASCALLAAGCASSTSSSGGHSAGTVVVQDDANGKTVNATVGQTVELTLGSNYWTVSGSSAPSVLRQDGAATTLPRPTNCPNVPGMGCVPIRASFTALAPGTASVTASRMTCGEARPCAPNQQHFTVTVVVK